MHTRTAIRKAVAAALNGAGIVPLGRVFTTRFLPYQIPELPAMAVYTLAEQNEVDFEVSPRVNQRTLQLAVEVAVSEAEDADDTLDTLCAQVEASVLRDETQGGTADDTLYESTDVDAVDIQDRTVAIARVVFSVTYYKPAKAPDTLDDFLTGDASTQTPTGAKSRDVFPMREES